MPVPNSFASATTSIPLSQLDQNFNTPITLGNTAIQLGNTVTTLNNMTLANATVSSGNVTVTSASLSGNLTFTGTGNRITGDFSNATVANRVAFQTSTTNGNTSIGALPNGTSVTANFRAFNNPDLTNSGWAAIQADAGTATFTSGINGTGTYLPMVLLTSGTEKLRIAADATGTYTFGGTAPRITGDFSNATVANRAMFQTSTTNAATPLGVIPNGTGVNSSFGAFANSDPTNTSFGSFGIFGGADVRVQSAITGTGSYLPMTFYTGGSERMRIDTSGNVGIGTSSPAFKLDIVASANASLVSRVLNTNTGASTQSILQLGTGASAERYSNLNVNYTSQYFQNTGVNITTLYQDYDTQIFRKNDGTERARIDSSGNLLVGATSLPTSSVSVAGVGVFNASGTAGRINLGKTASGTLDGLSNYHNGTYVGGITYSNTATALVASSDERLKENIVAAPSALEKAMSIEVVSYDWKHDPTHVEFGLVAQRLNSIYSEAVNVGDDGEEVEKTWGVEYGRLTPMLLKAIQEQQQMIETLQAKVAALEGKK